jgi:small-conductance mechanosensitive channel/CRP-like cAMP-binding protein
MPHDYQAHLIVGIAAMAVTLAIQSFTVNRMVRRKLRLSVALLGAHILVNVLLAAVSIEAMNISDDDLRDMERLALAAAFINLLVVSLVNPLRVDRVPDRFPNIVQDFLVIGFVLLAGTFLSDKLIATSAVGAVVVGFALQDTLGNAFAGLAIQSEAPFHIGNWIQVGTFEGRVAEVTWRATKLRTRNGNFVIVPNNQVAKEAIVNFTEPAVPTRLEVEVGASYMSAPNLVKGVLIEAMRQVPRVLEAPAPDALLLSFDDSAVRYRARFWVVDCEFDDEAMDEVRRAIYYAFNRHDIEIPWPIQVAYERDWPEPDAATKQIGRERLVATVDLFARLDDEQRRTIAARAAMRTFGTGEAIVRAGDAGHSMFVICEGSVGVVLPGNGRDVATIERGGHFGEMSLLTGEPRSATVVARGDTTVLEIDAESFRAIAASDPEAMEAVAAAAVARGAELDAARTVSVSAAVTEVPATLLARMRKFLRLRAT